MFRLIKIENARMNVPEPVIYEANEAITAGEALILSGGKLTKATTAPEFIALASAPAGADVPVARITPDHVYEVPVTAAPTALVPGDKVTLSEDALGVTTTTEGGVVTVVSLDGATAAGDTIIVRF